MKELVRPVLCIPTPQATKDPAAHELSHVLALFHPRTEHRKPRRRDKVWLAPWYPTLAMGRTKRSGFTRTCTTLLMGALWNRLRNTPR